ncbi:MAG TPA: hypothetical protein VF318_01030 [Dehalococcoidales bacterium]|jgi:hypothetical protein
MLLHKFILILNLLLALTMIAVLSACGTTYTPVPTSTTGGMHFVVTDSDHNIMSGVMIVSERQPEGQLKVTGITTLDANGLTFDNLKPGDYNFSISKADYQGISLTTNVVAGQTYTYDASIGKIPGAGATTSTSTN